MKLTDESKIKKSGRVRIDWVPDRLKARKWNGQPFRYAHAKLDGWCASITKQDDERLVIYGRETIPSMELTKRYPAIIQTSWWPVLQKLMPKHSCVYGELTTHTCRASDVPTALKDGSVQFFGFAIPYFDGNKQFRKPLAEVQKQCHRIGVPFIQFFTAEEMGTVDPEVLMNRANELGIEGWVLKNANYTDWWKLKRTPTLDAIITGVHPGKGKYEGQVGSLIVSVWDGDELIEIAKVGGMTDEIRLGMTNMHDARDLLLRVIEVKYQYAGAKGRLRHPRFMRWRPDKPNSECTADQVKE